MAAKTANQIAQMVLLTRPAIADQLTRFLRQFKPDLACHAADTIDDLDILSGNVGAQARLIAFGTDLLVPGPWLARFAYGAYNFHPGPPAYPGWAPASFALYDGATIFGATLHAMVERADSGAIVGTELFPISASITADHLAHQATQAMARLLRRMGPLLATHPEALPALPVEWGAQRGSKARLARLSRPDASLDAAERARRERAFTSADFVHQAALARQDPEADQPAAAAARR